MRPLPETEVPSRARLMAENQALREQLAQAQETLRAIHDGEIDALVMADSAGEGERVFTLAGSDASYRALIEDMSEGAFVLTEDAQVFYANRRLGAMLKTPAQALVGRTFTDWVDPADRTWFQTLLSHDSIDGKRGLEILLVASDDSRIPCHLSVSELPIADGAVYFSLVATDLSEHKEHESRILAAEKLARSILEQAAEAIVVCDRGSRILRVNRLARSLCVSNPLSQHFEDAFPLCLDDGSPFRMESHVNPGSHQPFEARLQGAGIQRSLLVGIGPWFGAQGEALGSIVTLTDISQRKAAEDEIFQLAFHDFLTQLPNRRMLQESLRQLLTDCARHGRRGALVFIDLDNFKTLNDTLGHDYGDLLLKQVARRLLASVRKGDRVARLGGDEFVVILKDLDPEPARAARQAEKVCAKIHQAINQSYQLAGHEHHVTPSMGVTLFGDHETTLDDLLKQADLAMYQAKASGRDTLRFFDPTMQQALDARARLEQQLREALRNQGFHLDYQPQVDRTGRIIGAEALLRWTDPEQGPISPAHFIPLAEETGLILPLGQWVLETGCDQLALWGRNSATAHLSLAINVSAQQFRQGDFVAQVREVIRRHAFAPGHLKLELTETLLLKDLDDTRKKMTALKQLGIGFSLDDFGTGYSSLAYLKRLPLDQLKIDQSFVRDLLANPSDAAIVNAILALAHSLELETIAEGVEYQDQQDFLLEHGCNAFQGYLFGRPGPAEVLSARCAEHHSLACA